MSAAPDMRLDRFQDHFFESLGDPSPSAVAHFGAIASQPGFAVYRNTVAKSCIDALAANYPTVARLVGEEWFRAAAALFARDCLPRHPALVLYGEGFADFLGSFAPAAELPYLAGVAKLDRFWSEAHTAADAPVLDAAMLSRVPPERMGRVTLSPHPAARWAFFPAEPVYSIWRDNREGHTTEMQPAWRGEGGLVSRPRGSVEWRALDEAGCALLDACASGLNLGEAAGAAMQARSDIDLRELLAAVLNAGAFSGFAVSEQPR